MSVMPSPAIGEVVDRVSSWAPRREDPDGEFTYVDLSAVDQDSKTIASPRRLACKDAPSRARQIIRSGDVLVSTVRPNLNGVGACAFGTGRCHSFDRVLCPAPTL